MLDLTVQMHPCAGGEDVLVLLHDLVHMLLSRGRGHNLLLSLRVYHKERKFIVFEMSLINYFAVTRETVADGATSSILYNVSPNVTITM